MIPSRGRRSDDIDRLVGARIRQGRIMLGLTQLQLAEMLGVTTQQTYKYEAGTNRISAGRLYYIAQALNVNVDYFFKDMHVAPVEHDAHARTALQLARYFSAIRNLRHRKALIAISRLMATDDIRDEDGCRLRR